MKQMYNCAKCPGYCCSYELIPLTKRACAVLTLWLARFPAASEQSFVFSRHSVGLAGDNRAPLFYHVDLDRPIGEWKKAWAGCLGKAGTRYRWHDLRHTFITRLLEDPNVSEETIRALAGHVSKKMLERYSHIRLQAKQAAIAALDRRIGHESIGDGAQNGAQSQNRAPLN